MATIINRPNGRGALVRCNLAGTIYLDCITFEFAGTTNDPDTVNPSAGVTIAHSATGTYTVTFDEDAKPKSVLWGHANLAEADAATYKLEVGEYVPSTGVLTLYAVNDPDTGTGGQPALANMADAKTCKLLLLCSDSKLADLQG